MIEADCLSRRYGEFLAVDNVSFGIGHGEIVIEHRTDRRAHDACKCENGDQALAAVGSTVNHKQQAKTHQAEYQRYSMTQVHGH